VARADPPRNRACGRADLPRVGRPVREWQDRLKHAGGERWGHGGLEAGGGVDGSSRGEPGQAGAGPSLLGRIQAGGGKGQQALCQPALPRPSPRSAGRNPRASSEQAALRPTPVPHLQFIASLQGWTCSDVRPTCSCGGEAAGRQAISQPAHSKHLHGLNRGERGGGQP